MALALLTSAAPLTAGVQDPAAGDKPADTPPSVPAEAHSTETDHRDEPLSTLFAAQSYDDPKGRFSFTAPANWARLADDSPDEVTFQAATGSNIRVAVAPLRGDRKSFLENYVDTYLQVLTGTFTNPKFEGMRTVTLAGREVNDYRFSATYGSSPVTCRQLVVLGGDEVLYVTFAGYGASRDEAESLFTASLLSFWISPSFGASRSSVSSVPGLPTLIFPVPEGWIGRLEANGSNVFRPEGARPTSPMIASFVSRVESGGKLSAINADFIQTYSERLRGMYAEGTFELLAATQTTMGGLPAVRYDFAYISQAGMRRGILGLCVKDGFVIGVSCDCAETAYRIFKDAFDRVYSSFRFK